MESAHKKSTRIMLIVDAQGGELRAKYGDGLIKKFSERLKFNEKVLLISKSACTIIIDVL